MSDANTIRPRPVGIPCQPAARPINAPILQPPSNAQPFNFKPFGGLPVPPAPKDEAE